MGVFPGQLIAGRFHQRSFSRVRAPGKGRSGKATHGRFAQVLCVAISFGLLALAQGAVEPGKLPDSKTGRAPRSVLDQAALSAWTLRRETPSPFPDPAVLLKGIAFGNGEYVAVGEGRTGYPNVITSGKVLATSDPAAGPWTPRYRGPQIISSVVFAAGQFVAVGDAGLVLTSDDGLSWTPQTSGTSEGLSAITYGNGMLVAAGANGIVLRSKDGRQWDQGTIGTKSIRDLAFGNGRFVAVFSSGAPTNVFASSDAVHWSQAAALPSSCRLQSITFGAGRFVLVGDATADPLSGPSYGAVFSSTDGLAWQPEPPIRIPGSPQYVPDNQGLRSVGYGSGKFITVSLDSVFVSTNANTWVQADIPALTDHELHGEAATFTKVASAGPLSFVIGAFFPIVPGIPPSSVYVISSDNGTDWKHISREPGLNGITYGKGLFVAVSNNGTILKSRNGADWEEAYPGGSVMLNDVDYGNGTFVAVGVGGAILTSNDGTVWVRESSGTRLDLLAVTHTADRFVTVGGSAPYYGHESSAMVMLASVPNDPHHWIARLSGRGAGSAYSRDVTYGNNHILAVGPDFANKAGWGRAWVSSDLSNWSSRLIPPAPESVAAGLGTFACFFSTAAATSHSTIRTTKDGLNWTTCDNAPGSVSRIVFCGGTFVALRAGSILVSTNGLDWTQQMIGATSKRLRDCAFGAGTFVAVGDGGVIVQSASVIPVLLDPVLAQNKFQATAFVPANQTAILESSGSLSQPDWKPVQVIDGGPSGASQAVTNSVAPGQARFYRLRTN